MVVALRVFVTLSLTVLISAYEVPECSKWTAFYNRDDPEGVADYEHVVYLRVENPGEICLHPTAVEARLLDDRPYTDGKDAVFVSPEYGLVCYNSQQVDGKCNDYKVRFCCP